MTTEKESWWLHVRQVMAEAASAASEATQDLSLSSPGAILALVVTLVVSYLSWRRLRSAAGVRKAVKEFVVPGEGPRFRKRDRIAFMSKRVLRNAKAVGSYIRGGQGRKRRDVSR